jgi:signal transduction histidine kinase
VIAGPITVDCAMRAELTRLLDRVRALLELDGLSLLLPTADGKLAAVHAPAELEPARPTRRGARARSSLIGIPLTADDTVIGVLLTEVRYPRRFTWRIVRLVELATECLALVVRQRHRAEEIEAVAEELALPPDDEAILARAAEKTRRVREVQQTLREQNELLLASAHDLKNLVTPVQVRVDTLRVEATRVGSPERENLAHGLARIELALRRLDRLADDFIDVAGMRGGQSTELHLCPVDLVAAASEATAEWQQTTSRHRLRLSSATPSLVGWWDPSRIARLLDNLVQNAIKYSPQGGEIEVAVERLVERGREWALLRVRDHGLGIPLEEQGHVFTPFRRAANVAEIKGSGIGLTAVRQIAEQHRGTVTVDSVPGLGSTFTVRLPVSGAEPTPAPGRVDHLITAESEA